VFSILKYTNEYGFCFNGTVFGFTMDISTDV